MNFVISLISDHHAPMYDLTSCISSFNVDEPLITSWKPNNELMSCTNMLVMFADGKEKKWAAGNSVRN